MLCSEAKLQESYQRYYMLCSEAKLQESYQSVSQKKDISLLNTKIQP